MAHTILPIEKVGSLQHQSSCWNTEAVEPVSGDGVVAQQFVALGIVATGGQLAPKASVEAVLNLEEQVPYNGPGDSGDGSKDRGTLAKTQALGAVTGIPLGVDIL
jgi:hypothetical protein